jgi:hypothetical protein
MIAQALSHLGAIEQGLDGRAGLRRPEREFYFSAHRELLGKGFLLTSPDTVR